MTSSLIGQSHSWFKSIRSGGANNNCVEVRFTTSSVDIRDSKNTNGPTLTVSSPAWANFLDHLRHNKDTMHH